jgi:hypothetical protein
VVDSNEFTESVSHDLRVLVRPLPKVVFFYATWIVSLVCAVVVGFAGSVEETPTWVGQLWVWTFFFNVLVISFDFSEERSLIAVLGVIASSVLLMYFNVLGPVSHWFGTLIPKMNSTFYWLVFTGFSIIYGLVWLNTRLDYWVIRPNEVIHRYGIFPKVRRYGTDDMRVDKTVPDMLEKLLLGTGQLVLTTPHESHPIVLNHVARIGSIDNRIADILGVKAVIHTDGKH